MRPLVHATRVAVVLALLGGAGTARAWDGAIDATTVFQAYEVRPPGTSAVLTRRRLLQTIGVEWTDALADRPDADGHRPRVELALRLRMEQELGDTCLVARVLCVRATDATNSGAYQPLARDTNVDLPSASLALVDLPLGMSLRVGRQLVWDVIGFARVDGGRARAEPLPYLAVEALGGQLVTDSSLGGSAAFELAGVPRLALPADLAARTPFVVPPVATFVGGAAIEVGKSEWARARLGYRETWSAEGPIARRLATSVVSQPIPELRVTLDGVWELLDGTLVEGAVGVLATPVPAVSLSMRAARHVPRFDPGTIWAYFSVTPITEGELGATWRPSTHVELGATARVRHADLGTLQTADLDVGGEGRARLRLGPASIGGSGFLWSGSLGPTAGVLFDGDLALSREVSLEAAASVWYFDDPLRAELYGVTVSEMVGARWRLGSSTTLMAEVEHAASRVVGNRVRALLSLSIEVWR